MAERSKALSFRFRLGSWKRKVVGSNPNDNLYRIVSFTFADADADTSIEKRRLLRGNKLEPQQCDEARPSEARGRSNQPSSRGIAIYQYCNKLT